MRAAPLSIDRREPREVEALVGEQQVVAEPGRRHAHHLPHGGAAEPPVAGLGQPGRQRGRLERLHVRPQRQRPATAWPSWPRSGRTHARRPAATAWAGRAPSWPGRLGVGAGGGTRTHTVWHLKPVPLPLGYAGAGQMLRRAGVLDGAASLPGVTHDLSLPPMPRADGPIGNPTSEIFNRLLKDRIIILGTDVNDDIANIICAQMLYLEGEDERQGHLALRQQPRRLGHGRHGHLRHDAVHRAATWPRSAWAWPRRWASSCSAPAPRASASPCPHARIMMHQPSGGVRGQASDIAIQAEQLIYIKRLMAERIAHHTGPDGRADPGGQRARPLVHRRAGQGLRHHRPRVGEARRDPLARSSTPRRRRRPGSAAASSTSGWASVTAWTCSGGLGRVAGLDLLERVDERLHVVDLDLEVVPHLVGRRVVEVAERRPGRRAAGRGPPPGRWGRSPGTWSRSTRPPPTARAERLRRCRSSSLHATTASEQRRDRGGPPHPPSGAS